MAESAPAEIEKPAKGKLILTLLLVVVAIVAVAGSIAGVLLFTGVLNKKPAPNPETELAAHDSSLKTPAQDPHGKPAEDKGAAKGEGKAALPQKKAIPAEAQTRYEKSYMDLDDKKPLVTNIANSRKVMQVSLSLMTQYDERVFKNVEKHRAALRSAALDVLRQVQEGDLVKPEARSQLAQRLRDQINLELERLEGFGGIEEVFFTEFVFQ